MEYLWCYIGEDGRPFFVTLAQGLARLATECGTLSGPFESGDDDGQ